MPKRSNPNAPAAAGKSLKLDKIVEVTPQPKKTMEDLPPEVKTIILDHVTRNESRETILGYRLVNSQWKDIIGSLLEKKITSGHSDAFPVMRIHKRNSRKREDLLFIRHSATMLPADRNPFPSNSVLLYGKGGGTAPHYFPESVSDIQRMDLPDFNSKYGGYLTSLTLQVVTLPGMNSLVTLLSSMTSLKVLSLVTVYFDERIIKSKLVFPTPPTLPNLTSLNVECGRYDTRPSGNENEAGRLDEKQHILYVWLIAFYADQLMQLNIKTGEPLPALLRRFEYYYTFPSGKVLPIIATSDSAFGFVKKLVISGPGKQFLRLSEFPKLQRLSVTGWPDYYHLRANDNRVDFQDLLLFISKCGNTLEKLCLHVAWSTLIGLEKRLRYEQDGTLPPLFIGSPAKIKTLEIYYSRTDDQSEDIMISRFLALFPSLKSLHFLCFPASHMATVRELGTMNRSVAAENPFDRIVAAKMRLAFLEQELYERTMRFKQLRAAIPRQARNWYERRFELDRQMNAFKIATNVEKNEIFNGLAALGVKRQDVAVELFLERQGIWNTCANLKLVSVSSGEKPDGDVCILRRPEGL